MICTDKEQETCEVEKRSCKGCFYSTDIEQTKANLKEYLKFCEEQGFEQDRDIRTILNYVDTLENTCLHCGNGKAAYCEECYQELISENMKLKLKIKNFHTKYAKMG